MQINVWNVNQIESAQSAVNRGLNCRQQCDRQQCWPTPNKCWKVAPVWGWGIGDRVSMARFWGNSTNRKSVSTVKFWTDATVPHRSRTFDSSVKFRFISVRDLSSLCSNPMSMMPNWNLANSTNELTKSLTKSISRQRSAWTSIDNLNSNVTMNACIVSCRFAEVLDDGENRSIIKKMRMKVSRWRTWTLNNERTWGGDLMNRQKNLWTNRAIFHEFFSDVWRWWTWNFHLRLSQWMKQKHKISDSSTYWLRLRKHDNIDVTVTDENRKIFCQIKKISSTWHHSTHLLTLSNLLWYFS